MMWSGAGIYWVVRGSYLNLCVGFYLVGFLVLLVMIDMIVLEEFKY